MSGSYEALPGEASESVAGRSGQADPTSQDAQPAEGDQADPSAKEDDTIVVMTLPNNMYGSFISAAWRYDERTRKDNYGQCSVIHLAKAVASPAMGLFVNYSIQLTFFSIIYNIIENKIEEDPDCMSTQNFEDKKASLFLKVYALTIFGALKDWMSDFKVVMFGTLRVQYHTNEDNSIARDGLSVFCRLVCVMFVLIPEIILFVVLLFFGSKYIMLSPDMESMLLNCCALAFIAECDELIFQGKVENIDEDGFKIKLSSQYVSMQQDSVNFVFLVLYLICVNYWPDLFMWYLSAWQSSGWLGHFVDSVFGIPWQAIVSVALLMILGPIIFSMPRHARATAKVLLINSSLLIVVGFAIVMFKGYYELKEHFGWSLLLWLIGEGALITILLMACPHLLLSLLGRGVGWTSLPFRFCYTFAKMFGPEYMHAIRPDRHSCEDLKAGKYAYGYYSKFPPDGDGTCLKMEVQLQEYGTSTPQSKYLLESSTADDDDDGLKIWTLTCDSEVLAKSAPVRGDVFPDDLEPSEKTPGASFRFVDGRRAFVEGPVERCMICSIGTLVSCCPCVSMLVVFMILGLSHLQGEMFLAMHEDAVAPHLDITDTEQLDVGVWHSKSGCPTGIHPCELDGSICVDLRGARSDAFSPFDSLYQKWCPIVRSSANCSALGWQEASSRNRLAVPFCARTVNLSSASLPQDFDRFSATLQACEGIGARMCRPSELELGGVAGWSSEPCIIGSHWYREVDGSWGCADVRHHGNESSPKAAICCADRIAHAWDCAAEPSQRTCTVAPCSEDIGPTNCVSEERPILFGFKVRMLHYCRCDSDHCELDGKCVKPTEHLLASQARFRSKKLKSQCRSPDNYVGKFLSAKGCAAEVARRNGTAFGYDNSSFFSRGWCYLENTSGHVGCPDGFDDGTFDFYEFEGP